MVNGWLNPGTPRWKNNSSQKKKKTELCRYLPQGTHSVVVEIQVWVTQSWVVVRAGGRRKEQGNVCLYSSPRGKRCQDMTAGEQIQLESHQMSGVVPPDVSQLTRTRRGQSSGLELCHCTPVSGRHTSWWWRIEMEQRAYANSVPCALNQSSKIKLKSHFRSLQPGLGKWLWR